MVSHSSRNCHGRVLTKAKRKSGQALKALTLMSKNERNAFKVSACQRFCFSFEQWPKIQPWMMTSFTASRRVNMWHVTCRMWITLQGVPKMCLHTVCPENSRPKLCSIASGAAKFSQLIFSILLCDHVLLLCDWSKPIFYTKAVLWLVETKTFFCF